MAPISCPAWSTLVSEIGRNAAKEVYVRGAEAVRQAGRVGATGAAQASSAVGTGAAQSASATATRAAQATSAVATGAALVGVLLAIPLHHHGTSTFRWQLRAVWRHRVSAIGFGTTNALLLGVPFTPLWAVVAPMVFTGVVLRHRRMRRAEVALGWAAGLPTPPAPGPPALPVAGTAPPRIRQVAGHVVSGGD